MDRRHEFTRLLMGVEVRILLYASDDGSARLAAGAAFDRIAAIEGVASDWRPASEVMRLCAAPAGEPVALSGDLLAMLDLSQRVAHATGGAFDVTIGPVTHLWREARASGRMPTERERRGAMARVGFRHLMIDHEARTATLGRAGMLIDLGGVAQGYAAGEALGVLRRAGFPAACVDVSGDVALGDPPPGAQGWRVAVPGADGWRTLVLARTAVSTSGDGEQFLVVGGARESHIIAPITGRGVAGVRSVTVVHRDAALADALATAVTVMGAERGLELVERIAGAGAAMVTESEDGSIEEGRSSRFSMETP